MKAIPGLVLLILAGTALADPVKIMEPCKITDFECLKVEARDFFGKSAEGIPALGTVSIDPLAIPAFDVVFGEGFGVTFKLRNVHVTGLKNQKLYYYNLNKQTRQFLLTMETDLFIGADIVVDYTKKSKTFTGYFTSQPTVYFTSRCDLLIKKNDTGVDYYKVGPETIRFDLVTGPQLEWSNELKQQLDNDVSWKTQSEETFKKFAKQTIDEIVSKALTFPISNMREAGKHLQTTAVFIE